MGLESDAADQQTVNLTANLAGLDAVVEQSSRGVDQALYKSCSNLWLVMTKLTQSAGGEVVPMPVHCPDSGAGRRLQRCLA